MATITLPACFQRRPLCSDGGAGLGPLLLLATLLVEVGVTIAAGIHTKLSNQNVRLKNALSLSVILNAVLIGLGTLAFTIGVRYYNIGIVAILSNSTALVATLLGIYLYHERLHTKERVAAVMMILGVAALSAL